MRKIIYFALFGLCTLMTACTTNSNSKSTNQNVTSSKESTEITNTELSSEIATTEETTTESPDYIKGGRLNPYKPGEKASLNFYGKLDGKNEEITGDANFTFLGYENTNGYYYALFDLSIPQANTSSELELGYFFNAQYITNTYSIDSTTVMYDPEKSVLDFAYSSIYPGGSAKVGFTSWDETGDSKPTYICLKFCSPENADKYDVNTSYYDLTDYPDGIWFSVE